MGDRQVPGTDLYKKTKKSPRNTPLRPGIKLWLSSLAMVRHEGNQAKASHEHDSGMTPDDLPCILMALASLGTSTGHISQRIEILIPIPLGPVMKAWRSRSAGKTDQHLPPSLMRKHSYANSGYLIQQAQSQQYIVK
jgi:hypothetical protein